MNFKFFEGVNTPSIFFRPITFEPSNVEFCFQFGDEDPIVIAQGQNECVITINPTMGGNLSFNDNGKVFKLFARERQ